MGTASTFDIQFCGCEIVLLPSQGTMDRLKSARKMTAEIGEILDKPRQEMVTDLVVDMHQIGWISSVGLNELIRIKQRSSASGIKVRLRSLNQTLVDVFRLTRLERTFALEVSETSPEAPDAEGRIEEESVAP